MFCLIFLLGHNIQNLWQDCVHTCDLEEDFGEHVSSMGPVRCNTESLL